MSTHAEPSTADRSCLYQAVSTAREFDFYDPAMRQAPDASPGADLEVLRLLREHLPIAFSAKMNQWWVFGYDEAREIFEDPDRFSNVMTLPEERSAQGGFQENQTQILPHNVDLPEHEAYRRLLNPLFSPARMALLETDLTRYAGELLDPIVARGHGEFVEEFAAPFPTVSFCRLIGFPLEDHPRLMRWKDAYINSSAPTFAQRYGLETDASGRTTREALVAHTRSTSTEIIAYLTELIARRRAAPQDDLMSSFTQLRMPDGRGLTDEELVKIGFNLILGGLDTVTSTLSLTVWDFAQHPERRRQFVALMEDDKALTVALAELLRFHALVPMNRRVARDCTLQGAQLREDDILMMDLTSACRDATRFERPDELVLDRQPNPHLGFGHGRHRCLGMHLARLEMKIALRELHRRMPDYHVRPGASPVRSAGNMRGIYDLELVAGAA